MNTVSMNNHGSFQQNSRLSRLEKYWIGTEYKALEEPLDYKDINLPLARIKRLMRVEEGVKMIGSEVPILFSKITQNFIEELTLRSWLNTDENKRRILQRTDILSAVKTSDMYDFLIYIIPKNVASGHSAKLNKINIINESKDISEEYIGRNVREGDVIPNNQRFN